ncbi:hypothetical protein ACFV1B_14460 [Streptomyces sp. NPDC059637]|uniref:hypothetical protein n=1 Tax=Streptomyces sp. NPDC059637 TaxID=3347752 RepID=UPI003674DA06
MNGVHGAGPDAGQEPSREGRLSEETAERLLRGDPVDTSDPVARELAALLGAARQAASGPGRGEPLPGEEAAVAAFRAARTGADGAGALRGLRTVRGAVVAAVAALAFGGVAIAAGTGLIPTPFGDGGPDRPASTPTASAGPTGGSASSTPDGAHYTEVTGGGEDGGSGKGAEPDDGAEGADVAPGAGEDGTDAETAVLVGLCRALEASAGGSGEGAPSREETERALTEAAGGKDVASFCDGLLEAEERGGPGVPAGNGGAAAGASGGRGSAGQDSGGRGSAGQGSGGASEGSGAAGAAAGSGSSGTSGTSGAPGSSGASGSSGNSSGGSGSGGAERGGGGGAGGRDGGSAGGASGGGSAAGGSGASAG